MRPAILILALSAALPMAAAHAQQQVYAWKDANGVTHYSQTPPPKGAYQIKSTRRGPNPPPATAAAAPVSEQCQTARSNQAMLSDPGKKIGVDKDGDGKADAEMSAQERLEQKALAEANINVYCKPAASPAK